MIPTHFLDPCSHRVSSVAKRIFISQLASFFTPRFGIASCISLWFISLRLTTVGFDFRVFHAVSLAASPWTATIARPGSNGRSRGKLARPHESSG